MNIRLHVALASALFSAAAVVAQSPQNVVAGLTGAGAPLAMHGYDPVGYFTAGLPTLGSAKFTAKHGGVAYRFVSEANMTAFQKSPSSYLPQFGGFCAFGVTVNKKFDGDPRVFAVVDGKLYFNLNPDIQGMWNKDVPGNIRKAEGNWGKLRTMRAHEMLRQNTINTSSSLTAAGAPLAMHGYDPVGYFVAGMPTVGSAKFTAKHGEAAYRFASAANMKAFEANPDAYLPQFGGFCAFGASVGKKFDGDPRVFAVVDGKLYFNLNPEIQAMWNKDVPGNIAKATKQWSKIRDKAVAEL